MVVEKALEKDPAERYQSMREMVVDLRRLARSKTEEAVHEAPASVPRRHTWLWAAGVALALVAGAGVSRLWMPRAAAPSYIQSQRLTDFVGIEEQPAVSSDGKLVAFVAPDKGRRQVWVRSLGGGAPKPVTQDNADHEHPRWAPDSTNLIYYSGAEKEGEPGTLWEVAAIGGTPRPIAISLGEGDISHDGLHIATFQRQGNQTVLAILKRDGTLERVKQVTGDSIFSSPRWSPDDHSIAFDGSQDLTLNHKIYVTDSGDGAPKLVASASQIQGLAWLPNGSGLVYASSAGSTMVYPPIFNLRTVSKDGGPERQLTFCCDSYVEPDIVAPGKVFVSRVKMQSDIWRYPVAGSPEENTNNGLQITHQTGQIQTPSVSPKGDEIVYLSDSGGHSNLWVAKVDGSSPPRQILFEQDPAVGIGVPVWSPAGDKIVFVRPHGAAAAEWLVNPDGSGPREFIQDGRSPVWSAKGEWLYYTDQNNCIHKIPAGGGNPVDVRCGAVSTGISSDGSTIYYEPTTARQNEIFRASPPESGTGGPFARYAPSRVPILPNHPTLSRDDKWLAVPLKDAGTTNIWVISTADASFHKITDFKGPTLIARQVSWSPDGDYIFAAVVNIDADIYLLDGMLP